MKHIFFVKLCLLLGLTVLAACGGGSPDPGPPPPDNTQNPGGTGTSKSTGTGTGSGSGSGTGSGSGSGSLNASNVTETNFATTCSSATEVLFARSEQAKANANVEVIALACGAPISSPKWTQTSGGTVSFTSNRSQAISFLPNTTGMREFTFEYKDAQGLSQTRAVRINIGASADTAAAIIRGEPSVWPASATSLRVWLPGVSSTDLDKATFQWKLLALSSSKLDNVNSRNVIITPTNVSNDTVVPVQADVQLADGRTWTQLFTLLVQKPDPSAPNLPVYPTASQVYPYVASSNPYADKLKKCIYARSIAFDDSTICKMSTLPVLGQSAADAIPSVEEVMQRVLVSNDWMGSNFERFLREQDASGQIRRMLASTTAVVIGGRIRPSFYTAWTGAIHLDADDLWLTPEQRDTISERPDYRAALSKPFTFELSYSYYKPMQGDDAPNISIESRQTRSLADMRKNILSLMVHELTHATDFVSPSIVRTLNPNQYLYEAVLSRLSANATATAILGTTYPLSCRDCFKLGSVLFQSATPTIEQKSLTGSQIAQWFTADNANDFYAYSVSDPITAIVSAEDTAMLAEETLMQLSYGFRRYTYILNYTNGKYSFQWGQSSRIGKPEIQRRAALVLTNTAPWFDRNQLASLEAPTDLASTSNSSTSAMKASLPDYGAQLLLQQQIRKQMQDRELRMQLNIQINQRLDAMRTERRVHTN